MARKQRDRRETTEEPANRRTTAITVTDAVVVRPQHYEVTPVGLLLPGNLSRENWSAIGQQLIGADREINFRVEEWRRRLQWWLGDWLNYGVDRGFVSHDRYDAALIITQYSRGYLQNLAWVARAFPSSRRRENQSWAHHYEVAGLGESEQKWLLDEVEGVRARSRNWLRKQVRELNAGREKLGADYNDDDGDADRGAVVDDPEKEPHLRLVPKPDARDDEREKQPAELATGPEDGGPHAPPAHDPHEQEPGSMITTEAQQVAAKWVPRWEPRDDRERHIADALDKAFTRVAKRIPGPEQGGLFRHVLANVDREVRRPLLQTLEALEREDEAFDREMDAAEEVTGLICQAFACLGEQIEHAPGAEEASQ